MRLYLITISRYDQKNYPVQLHTLCNMLYSVIKIIVQFLCNCAGTFFNMYVFAFRSYTLLVWNSSVYVYTKHNIHTYTFFSNNGRCCSNTFDSFLCNRHSNCRAEVAHENRFIFLRRINSLEISKKHKTSFIHNICMYAFMYEHYSDVCVCVCVIARIWVFRFTNSSFHLCLYSYRRAFIAYMHYTVCLYICTWSCA